MKEIKNSYLFQTNYHFLPRGIPAHECQSKASYLPVRKYSLCFVKMTQRCLHLKNNKKKKDKTKVISRERIFYQHVCFPGVSLLPRMFLTYDKILCAEITTACLEVKGHLINKFYLQELVNRTLCHCCTYEMLSKSTLWEKSHQVTESCICSFTRTTSASGTREHFKAGGLNPHTLSLLC